MPLTKTIKYDADRDRNFPQEIMSRPGGEKLYGCIQCGTCSATCPASIYMDHTPRQLMALTRAGFKKEALSSLTIWLCTSCYSCTVQCPKEIKITDIMYALKRQAIREGVYPKRFPIPILAREFYQMVRSTGRVTENWLAIKMFMKSNPIAALKTWRLGLNLMKTGRFPWKPEKMQQPARMAALLDEAEAGWKGGAR
jgi:heterodisulfide reductase subunit C